MNFVAQVEEKLRELGWEARKKYPGVKEASERATLQLRTLQNKYVAAVRQASSDNSIKHPTTAMFQSEDILRPFLWAANYPDINHTILSIVLNAIQLLIDGDAISSGDIIHVLRILSIHAHGCTHALNHVAGATILHIQQQQQQLAITTSSSSTHLSTTSSSTGLPMSTSTISSSSSTTGTGGIGSAILSSVSGMGSAMFSGFKGTSSTIAHAASGALSMSLHGGGYSSSTGHAAGHHRSWKEEEISAHKILQLLVRIVESRGYDLAEDIYTASIHIAMILLATDSILPMDLMTTAGGGSGSSGNNNSSSNSKGGGKATHGIEGGSSTGPLQAAKAVRRSAATTLRQLISLIFEKAIMCHEVSDFNISSNETQDNLVKVEDSDDVGIPQKQNSIRTSTVDARTRFHLQSLAYRTLQDILRLIFTNYFDDQENMHRPGSLSLALNGFFGHKLYPPPRSACLDLLVMILRQRVDLFTTCLDTRTATTSTAVEEGDESIQIQLDFASLLRNQLCPNIIYYLNQDRNSWTGPDRKGFETVSFLSVFLWFIKLIATIIELYGYANHAEAVDDAILNPGTSTTMENESKKLLSCLTQFVVDACEKIRDTGTFEDGFVYLGLEDEDMEGEYTSDFNIPLLVYWRASVCLEFFYSLFSDRREIFYSLHLIQTSGGDMDFFNLITTAAVDFATASASCKRGILSVVRFCESETMADPLNNTSDISKESVFFEHLGDFAIHRIYPTTIAKSREFLKNFDEWSTVEGLTNGPTNRLRSFSEASVASVHISDQLGNDAPHGLTCIGETTWVAFNCILLLAEFLSSFADVSDEKVKLELVAKSCSFFIQSLAILQHFIRRFPGSHFVMRTALSGYILLANTCFPLRYESEFHRKVLLGSLSSLSLTNAAQINAQSSISDQQLLSLTALLYITHLNRDSLDEDWFLVLTTLERAVNMTSSRSEEENAWTRSLSSCMCRLAQFSSCFSVESLVSYFKALCMLYHTDEDSSTLDVISGLKSPSSLETSSSKRDIGKAIFFTRGLPSDSSTKNLKPLGWAFYDHAYDKLVSSKLTKFRDSLRTLPFSLILLSLSMVENSFRLDAFYSQIVDYWNELICKSELSEIRIFSLDMLSNLASLGLSMSRMPVTFPSTIVVDVSSIDELFMVSTNQESNNLQGDAQVRPSREQLIAPLCQTLRTTAHREIAEACLTTINSVLEVAGHDIPAEAWVSVIDALSSVSGGFKNDATYGIDRTVPLWAPICNMAFRSLKLIVDDYLNDLLALSDSVGLSPRSALLDCCAAFGSSEHDVNTSLTASGMLWTIADRDTTAFSLHHVMSKLAALATDKRQEVRNCSVNTLFSCIVGLGQSFTAQQWRESIESTTFGIIDIINANAFDSHELEKSESFDKLDSDKDRYKVTRHHSRDSLSKQWIGTLILAIRGWDRILRLFFHKLLTLGSASVSVSPSENSDICSDGNFDKSHVDSILWLDRIWSRTLDWAYSCSIRTGGREILDLRMVSTDLLILCAQISSEYGIQAIATPARVGTNMQVVNGALRSVREANASTQNAICDVDLSDEAKKKKATLFLRAFDVLMRYEIFLKDEEAMSLELESVIVASTLFVETGLFNLLAKLSQGLSKLYECCKHAELTPNAENNFETGFLDLVFVILEKAAGTQRAKYINQAQRVCLDLLQSMASSSVLALGKLTKAAGSAFFCSAKEKSGFESVEMDAAHIVCDVLKKPIIPEKVKVYVLEKIIDLYDVKSLNIIDHTYRDYGLTVAAFNDGFRSLRHLEKKLSQDSDSQMQYIDTVWSKVYSFYEKLLSSHQLVSDPPTKVDDLADLITTLSNFSPWRKREELEILLSKTALDLATTHETDISESMNVMRIYLFRSTYTQLSILLPYSHCLQTISSTILSKAVDQLKTPSATNEAIVQYYTDISITMCSVIYAMTDASPLAASVYAQICMLLNSDNVLLRHEASNVLSKIGVASILHRQEEMQDEMRRLEKVTDEHEKVMQELEREKIRADTAEAQVQMLIDENRKLKERNSELQRQVSMLCDGSML